MFEGIRARVTCLLVAALAAACTLPNPAFDDAETEGRLDADADTDTDIDTNNDADTNNDPETDGDGDGDPSTTRPGDGDGDMCTPPSIDCEGTCVSTANDPLNCGGCGDVCPAEHMCQGSKCVDAQGVARVVFVTSQFYTGALGGLDGADAKCNERAGDAKLEGQFKAWIGVGPNNPASTFTQHGYFVLPDGRTIVANSWADLLDGTLDFPIYVNEFGEPADAPLGCNGDTAVVWTGVSTNGQTLAANCSGWTVSTGEGRVGYIKAMNESWTLVPMCGAGCEQALPIYCFEQ
ncbi:hypothetical protein [Enhygromyxa salina]|uniref:Myxococcus cysteine-rich repeat-containing protein n=1 Tax=Enhygromyxa salina TaxID=215803 RepID=A0A2S9YIP0_9BACT|nr:hypothetical protein [Enhygromyxa salina]PRQ04974.1 hypothetical protein ENSA7_49070 [Enhygromyxa salina]